MEEYTPYTVYENVIKMFGYRNITASSAQLSKDDVSQALNNNYYLLINGARDAHDQRGEATVLVVLMAPDNTYASKSAEFKRVMRMFPKTSPEVIFVAPAAHSLAIAKQIEKNKATLAGVAIESLSYSLFMIELPKHVLVPRHELVPEAEVTKFCHDHYIDRKQFPAIAASDPQAIWLGLRPGMCVRIYRQSNSVGILPVYRICV